MLFSPPACVARAGMHLPLVACGVASYRPVTRLSLAKEPPVGPNHFVDFRRLRVSRTISRLAIHISLSIGLHMTQGYRAHVNTMSGVGPGHFPLPETACGAQTTSCGDGHGASSRAPRGVGPTTAQTHTIPGAQTTPVPFARSLRIVLPRHAVDAVHSRGRKGA